MKKRGWRDSWRVLYYDSRADESGGRAKASPSTRAAQDVPWKLHNAKQLDFESNKPDATSLRRSNPSVNETTILLQEWHFEPTGSQIDYGLLWRVWSWLRTNAGGVLNTCKSNEIKKLSLSSPTRREPSVVTAQRAPRVQQVQHQVEGLNGNFLI